MCVCVCVGLVWVFITAAAAADMVTCSVCVISGYNTYNEVTHHRHALLLFMLSTPRSLLSTSQIHPSTHYELSKRLANVEPYFVS